MKNATGIVVGQVRQTVNLAVDANQQVQKKNVQYSTGFTLAPGKYHVKFVVRENQSGKHGQLRDRHPGAGHEEDAAEAQLHCAVQPASAEQRKEVVDPLVRDGQEWVPNVPHVFRQDQHLYFLYEVYSPARTRRGSSRRPRRALQRRESGPVHVLTSIEFLLGGVKVYETPQVEANAINVPERDAVGFEFDVPLTALKPGTYICQVNVIDDAGGTFSFPRMALAGDAACSSATCCRCGNDAGTRPLARSVTDSPHTPSNRTARPDITHPPGHLLFALRLRYFRWSSGTYLAGYSGPMYSARGRMRRLSSCCSITCADQPEIRLIAKIGVNRSMSIPGVYVEAE